MPANVIAVIEACTEKPNGVHKKIKDITEHSGELVNAEFDNGQTNGIGRRNIMQVK